MNEKKRRGSVEKMKMKMLIGFSIFFLSLVSGYFGYNVYSVNSTPNPNVINVHASWGEEFMDVKSLSMDSDLIVLATLNKELDSYQPYKDLEDTFTDAEINIEEVIKGDKNKNIKIISQYGGIRPDGKKEIFEELPLLEKDKKYLLFLEAIEDGSDRSNKYQTVRGVQGFYIVSEEESKTKGSVRGELKSIVNGDINRKVIKNGIEALREMDLE